MGLAKVITVYLFHFAALILGLIVMRYEFQNIRYEYKKTRPGLKLKHLMGLFAALAGLFGAVASLLTLNYTWNDIGYIPKICAVEYHNGSFNEGYYYGGWHDGMPQGRGTLTYDFFNDGLYYYICNEDIKYKAISYSGEFDKGYRTGEGVVIYEGGFREEGVFYGAWMEGKKVFEGKRWLTTETFHGYRECELYATSTRDGYYEWKSDWISVER